MKLLLAIVNNDDSARASAALTEHGFFVTKLSESGRGQKDFEEVLHDEKAGAVSDGFSRTRSASGESADGGVGGRCDRVRAQRRGYNEDIKACVMI